MNRCHCVHLYKCCPQCHTMPYYANKLLEYPIPTAPTAPAPSQKPSHGNISVTKRGIIDPLVSKRPEKVQKKKFSKKNKKNNGQKWSKTVKMIKMVQIGPKWSKIVQNGPKWSK